MSDTTATPPPPEMNAEDRAESLRMIRESAAAVAPRGGDLKRVRALRFHAPGYDPAVMRQMGEMGWIGLRLPEEAGGSALGISEFCALAEELGRGLAPEPLIEAALTAGLLADAAEKSPAAAQALEGLLAGEAYIATGWQDRPDTLTPTDAADAARLFVPAAGGATAFVLPSATGLGLIPAAEMEITLAGTQDGGQYGTLRARGAGQNLGAAPRLAAALDEAALATSAYLLGVMEAAFAMTLEYLGTRQQFGKIIGTFQVLQHRAADLKIQIALTRASVEAAALALDSGVGGPLRQAVVSRAKARAATASMLVTQQAIQLHGGIGYTDEYDVGLYLRKAMVLANRYGSAALHRRRFMAVAPEGEE